MRSVAVATNAALRVKLIAGEMSERAEGVRGPNSEHLIAWAVPTPAPAARKTPSMLHMCRCVCMYVCIAKIKYSSANTHLLDNGLRECLAHGDVMSKRKLAAARLPVGGDGGGIFV